MARSLLSGDPRSANWHNTIDRLPFFPRLSARSHRRTVCCRTRLADRCGRDGIRLPRFYLDSAREAGRTPERCNYLGFLGTDRYIWADLGHCEISTPDVRSLRSIHRTVLRDRTLAICLSALENRQPHRTIGRCNLDMGYRVPRKRKAPGSGYARRWTRRCYIRPVPRQPDAAD